MLFQKSSWLIVAFLISLYNVNAVEIACRSQEEHQCIFDEDVTLDEKEEIKIKTFDKLDEVTSVIFQAPLKTKFIPTVIFDKFPNLKSLAIFTVGLETISGNNFVNAKALTKLNIEGNNIVTLKANSFSSAKNLQELHLSENKITKIEDGAFEGLTELTALDLGTNNVANLDITTYTKFPKLTYLIVANMDFKFSGPYNSDEVAKIRALNSTVTRLDLSNNPIDSPDLFRRLSIFPNVETAYFTANKITHIDHLDEFKQLLPNLSEIVMDENPFDSKFLEEAKTFFSKEGVNFRYD